MAARSIPRRRFSFVEIVPASMPSEGPDSGGTTLTLMGQNFSTDSVIKMGTQQATNVSASAPTGIQATSVASVSNGPVNITTF
jgi:hypothetical protein